MWGLAHLRWCLTVLRTGMPRANPSLSQNLGVQFCSPPVAEGCDTASGSGDIDCPTGLKLECVNFTVRTMHLPTNASIWLQADMYPLSKPNTTYSFTVFSNGETLDESPISLEGAKAFTTTNDPNADVRLGYTYYPGKEWWPRHLRDGRKVPSLQVYTS
ncbi:hypothetical protein H257_19422 [Aphanomyces astaci]|uniref:Uncharacterized protein n=1 Tax=Aphanomyces astaci TaxID=112090 RepID=W4F872_APHAT|nr:hypothetical protein H257_19422 [Aphanomyces astaci]ETV63647.1 hypothetical protein H257_19422 [Aphanomyces astaci]|eukprot:XP_009846869.1 hypothetical protein H257_19422 [Aphanomyces astaci]